MVKKIDSGKYVVVVNKVKFGEFEKRKDAIEFDILTRLREEYKEMARQFGYRNYAERIDACTTENQMIDTMTSLRKAS